MKAKEFQQQLVEAARKLPDNDRVPYAFEKRIMARLKSAPQPDALSIWARGLWQASVPCLTLMIAVSTWSIMNASDISSEDPLVVDLELTMLQPFEELSVEELW